jgi:hypothetical protein
MHPFFELVRLLLLAGGLSAVALAQTCVVNSGNDPGSPGAANAYSPLAPANPGTFRRSQILVPAVAFENVPTRITELSYFLGNGWRQVHLEELTIKMGHTSVATLSEFAAANITSPLQTVMAVRDHVYFEGGGPGWSAVGLQTPFQYLPGSGNLLIEVVAKGGTVLTSVVPMSHWVVPYGSMVTAQSSTAPSILNFSAPPPRLRLCTDRAESILFGQTCQGSGSSTPLLGTSGRPTLGASTTLWLSDVPANAIAACAFGFDNAPPFPLLLTSFGAPGCRQYFPVAFAELLLADSLGIGTRTVAIPNVPATAGASVYAQYFVLDPPANALGITASNYVRLMAGF